MVGGRPLPEGSSAYRALTSRGSALCFVVVQRGRCAS